MSFLPLPAFQAQIADVVPLGSRLLLSVRGANRRPELPCMASIGGSGERVRLLELVSPPTLWLLGEVTLVAEADAGAAWRGWVGRTLSAG